MDQLAFYLIGIQMDTAHASAFVALPGQFTIDDVPYYLVAAIASDEQHAALLSANPPPEDWTGSVGDVLRLLCERHLNHLWWVFDTFIHRHNIATTGAYRNY